MFLNFQKKSRFSKIVIAILAILCALPILYSTVYRFMDYYVCRGLVSMKLGKGFAPDAIEGYVQGALSPGLSRDEVGSKLDEIGRIKVISLGRVNDTWLDQINLQICTDPFNRIIILANYTASGRLISIKIADEP